MEALALVGVWKSATTMSGAQFAMTYGTIQMLESPAGSWDWQAQVSDIRLMGGGGGDNFCFPPEPIVAHLMSGLKRM